MLTHRTIRDVLIIINFDVFFNGDMDTKLDFSRAVIAELCDVQTRFKVIIIW